MPRKPMLEENATLVEEWKADAGEAAGRDWQIYSCKLVTPLYGGGVVAGEVDREMPIRAASLRGQMRFWWRVACDSFDDQQAMFKREREIWGGIGDKKPVASRVSLRVRNVSALEIKPAHRYPSDPENPGKLKSFPLVEAWAEAYALFSAQGRLAKNRRDFEEKPKALAQKGMTFDLLVGMASALTDQQRGEVERSLRWWASFGGIGARTRRGLGSVQVTGLDPVSAAEVQERGGRLVLRPPVGDATAAWKASVGLLKEFRQGLKVGRNSPSAGSKSPAGRSLWPEADSLRELSGAAEPRHAKRLVNVDAFPRAAFGLPIVFHFNTLKEGEKYGDASKRLGGLLAARKATRDFIPAAKESHERPSYGIPKSSLDAARESVINVPRDERDDPESPHRKALRKLGLGRREQLDALAFTKRLAGNADQFTAYSRVAADAWIQTLTAEQQQEISCLYEPLARSDNDLATWVRGNKETYEALPYDAQLVYDFRLDNALARRDLTAGERQHLRALQRGLRRLRDQQNTEGKPIGAPVPYAVILKADGDRMGKLLSQAKEEQDSRDISQALRGFANGVLEIVRRNRGHAIYSGGDDVLVLLPLQNALAAAKELMWAFKAAMDAIAARLGLAEDARPTLSVGLGIGHLMEPLGALRARADEAEKAAKGDRLPQERQRNALAIRLGIRSGAEYGWRARWHDDALLADLTRLCEAYRAGELPSRVAYDLRAIAGRMGPLDQWASPEDKKDPERAKTLRGMRQAEVRRMLARARIEGGGKPVSKDLRDLLIARVGPEPESLEELADMLIIARWLSARTAADVGDRPNG
jgi:CRISPR-associated protein Cmr2